ncbi:MAG: agmatine deiminase family protein, partial [Aquisalimonadaceae bacterium]
MRIVPRPTRWLPPEWAAQQCVLLTWPHDGGDWGTRLADAETTFTAMARAIASRQALVVSCNDQRLQEQVTALLGDLAAVSIITAPSNDIWVRDHGPVTVISDGTAELLDFRFNGWGGRYPAALDDRIPATLVSAGLFPDARYTPINTVFEGGSIDTDGEGTLLVTSSCLLNPNRNGNVDRAWFETRAQQWFGCDRVLWLDHGALEGDDTDGHVDMLARFAPGDRILYTACDDPADSHATELAAMAGELRAFRTRSGRPYDLLPLP